MRHLKKGKKFHREKGQRKALFKSLLNNLIAEGKIETTEIKAKAIKPQIEKLITLGKKQTLASLRILISRLSSKKSAEKIYYEVSPKYKNRNGGYARIIKSGKKRKDDGAKMAIIEFV
jgi:large subunit ribosomal protein L17